LISTRLDKFDQVLHYLELIGRRYPVKTEVYNAYTKYMILKHAAKANNVSATCALFGISRATFYNWNRAYDKYGMAGLETKEPQKPQMPNRVNKKNEQEILDYVAKYPADGPKRIYYELKTEGYTIGESGIYNVLKRNHLSNKSERIVYSKSKAKGNNHSGKIVNKERTLRTSGMNNQAI